MKQNNDKSNCNGKDAKEFDEFLPVLVTFFVTMVVGIIVVGLDVLL